MMAKKAKTTQTKSKTKWLAPLAIAMLLSTTAIFATAYGATPPNYGTYQLPASPLTWLGFAIVAILVIIAAAALVYLIAGIVDSPTARAWSRLQLYESLLGIIIILVFLALAYLFLINPNGTFAAANLVGNGIYGCSTATDLFQLASCDMSKFNYFAFGMFNAIFYSTVYAGYTPGISFTLNPTGDFTNTMATVSAGLTSFFPQTAEESFAVLYNVLLFLFLLNQVQLMLLSGSEIFLAFFVSIGVIARVLGFTRSFGGALIALGLGLGFVYPLMTSISYGYIDYILSTPTPITGSGVAANLLVYLFELVGSMVTGIGAVTGIALPIGGWVYQVGVAIAGMTFIPFLNFTIVDAFIVDFSKAIGERLDFMSLLTGLV